MPPPCRRHAADFRRYRRHMPLLLARVDTADILTLVTRYYAASPLWFELLAFDMPYHYALLIRVAAFFSPYAAITRAMLR